MCEQRQELRICFNDAYMNMVDDEGFNELLNYTTNVLQDFFFLKLKMKKKHILYLINYSID